jgi:hypothetical protein
MRHLPSERSEKVRRCAATDRNPPTDVVLPPAARLMRGFERAYSRKELLSGTQWSTLSACVEL